MDTRQVPGSGNLRIHGRKLSHCAIFMRGCYVYKAGSNQSAPPISHALTTCNMWSAIRGNYCTLRLLENTIGRIRSI